MAKGRDDDEGKLAPVAAALEDELEQLESLTRRAGNIELSSGKEIVRAAGQLEKALEVHARFVELLTELTQSVGAARDRQSDAILSLQEVANALDARREVYAELERRFVQLGQAAQEINDLVRGDGEPDEKAMGERVGTAIDRLAEAADEAKSLAADAKEAGFVDVERQADAARQQLGSLRNKLEQARG